MGRWVTSKGRRIYIPDEGEENPFAKDKATKDEKAIRYMVEKEQVSENVARDTWNRMSNKEKEGTYKLANDYNKSKLDFSSNGTYNFNGQAVPKDLPRVSDNDALHNKVISYQGTQYQTQQVRDWDRNANKDYVAGHLYVPQNTLSKGSFFISKDNKIWHDGSQYLQAKNSIGYSKEYTNQNGARIKVLSDDGKQVTYRITTDKKADLSTAGPNKDSSTISSESFKKLIKANGYK